MISQRQKRHKTMFHFGASKSTGVIHSSQKEVANSSKTESSGVLDQSIACLCRNTSGTVDPPPGFIHTCESTFVWEVSLFSFLLARSKETYKSAQFHLLNGDVATLSLLRQTPISAIKTTPNPFEAPKKDNNDNNNVKEESKDLYSLCFTTEELWQPPAGLVLFGNAEPDKPPRGTTRRNNAILQRIECRIAPTGQEMIATHEQFDTEKKDCQESQEKGATLTVTNNIIHVRWNDVSLPQLPNMDKLATQLGDSTLGGQPNTPRKFKFVLRLIYDTKSIPSTTTSNVMGKELAIALQSSLASGTLTDVKFQFPNEEDKELTAHKVMLAARSRKFKNIFDQQIAENKGQDTSFKPINIVNFSYAEFKIFVAYLYALPMPTDINLTTQLSLLRAAHEYGVDELTNDLTQRLICATTPLNVIQVLIDADALKTQKLYKSSLFFAAKNLKYLQDDDLADLFDKNPLIFKKLLLRVKYLTK